jgi:hypothetical protein
MHTYEVRPRKNHRGVDIRSNQSMKPTPPLAMRLRRNATFCFTWRGDLSLSRLGGIELFVVNKTNNATET